MGAILNARYLHMNHVLSRSSSIDLLAVHVSCFPSSN